MRNSFLFSLPLTVITVAGCGPQPDAQAARSDLERDLTLVSRPPERAVSSPVGAVASEIELRMARAQQGSGASSHKVVRLRKSVRRPARDLVPVAARPVRPTTIERPGIADVVVPKAGGQPVTAVPADSRELLPGKTVTVIPVSSGPSPSGEGADDIPPAGTRWRGMGGGSGMGGSGMGGGCRPGRGTGIPELGGSPRPRGMLY